MGCVDVLANREFLSKIWICPRLHRRSWSHGLHLQLTDAVAALVKAANEGEKTETVVKKSKKQLAKEAEAAKAAAEAAEGAEE